MSRDGPVTGELAPVLPSDLDGGDTSFDVISAGEQAASTRCSWSRYASKR